MSKFKMGDTVRIKQADMCTFGAVEPMKAFVGTIAKINRIIDDNIILEGSSWSWDESNIELVSESLKTCANKNIMSKVKDFVKNLALSADEKLLRKHGFKNDCGEYTGEAHEALAAKLAKDNEPYFLELARGLEAEEKTCK